MIGALADRDAALRKLYMEVHYLVVETLPGIGFAIDLKDGMTGYGANQYGAGGWGIGALACHSRWVTLGFMRGASLPDPTKLLEGTGKSVRHVKIKTSGQLAAQADAIRALLRAAAGA